MTTKENKLKRLLAIIRKAMQEAENIKAKEVEKK